MKETMTRRQRVQKAVNGEKTDRMPIDLGMHFSTGISVFAYKRLREYLGFDTDKIEIADNSQMLARVEEDILQRFHVDCILLNPPHINPVKWNVRDKDEFFRNKNINPVLNEKGDWLICQGEKSNRMPSGGFFFDGDGFNASDYTNEAEALAAYAKRAEYLYKETDYYTMKMGFTAFFHGIDHACDMYTDPETVIEDQEKLLKDTIIKFDKMNKSYGKYIQCIEVNSDLGAQNAPMIDPNKYAEFCLPYLKQFCSHVHNTSDIKIFIHSCGSISPIIPHIIEAGVDILNPVQISADNMDPMEIKNKFGKKIALWGGGCDTQRILNLGTAEDVRKNVKELTDIFKPNGKYIFNQVHNIMGDVSPEKIVAMLDTAYENAFYE